MGSSLGVQAILSKTPVPTAASTIGHHMLGATALFPARSTLPVVRRKLFTRGMGFGHQNLLAPGVHLVLKLALAERPLHGKSTQLCSSGSDHGQEARSPSERGYYPGLPLFLERRWDSEYFRIREHAYPPLVCMWFGLG